jgi:hypothetical protein
LMAIEMPFVAAEVAAGGVEGGVGGGGVAGTVVLRSGWEDGQGVGGAGGCGGWKKRGFLGSFGHERVGFG